MRAWPCVSCLKQSIFAHSPIRRWSSRRGCVGDDDRRGQRHCAAVAIHAFECHIPRLTHFSSPPIARRYRRRRPSGRKPRSQATGANGRAGCSLADRFGRETPRSPSSCQARPPRLATATPRTLLLIRDLHIGCFELGWRCVTPLSCELWHVISQSRRRRSCLPSRCGRVGFSRA